MGDLNTGNGTPGSRLGLTEDDDDIDYHPGNGNGNGNGKDKGQEKNKNKGNKEDTEESTEEMDSSSTQETESTTELDPSSEEETVTSDVYDVGTTETGDEEVTEDITTELVKKNPYRYRHYYWDRKTQFYYLQARYYNPRLGRFISMDPWRGEMTHPLSLNRYVYTYNNPINYSDPSGLCVLCGDLKDLPNRDGTYEPDYRGISFALDWTPIASNAKSGYEAFVGVDPITGESVEGLTRVLAFGGIFTGKIVVNVVEGLINIGGRVYRFVRRSNGNGYELVEESAEKYLRVRVVLNHKVLWMNLQKVV